MGISVESIVLVDVRKRIVYRFSRMMPFTPSFERRCRQVLRTPRTFGKGATERKTMGATMGTTMWGSG
eukprot:7401866-Pyramimonas_sp.AAC.1